MVYVGIRLQCESPVQIITPAVMPILQCEIAKRQDEMAAILWSGGMLVKAVCEESEPKVEALVFVSDRRRSIRAIDLISRGPAYSHRHVKQFVDKLQKFTMQTVDKKSPGTPVKKRFLSHQHIRQHNMQPISYSQREVDFAKMDKGVLTRATDTEVVEDSVIDLLAVEDDHIIYKLQSLSKHCSKHWLPLGQSLLSYTDCQVHDLTSDLAEKSKFYHVVETWIRRQWRTATLDMFLTACDSVANGLRQLVETELGIRKEPPLTIPPARSHVSDSPVIRAILKHGSAQWYALGVALQFSNDEINQYCHNKAYDTNKLLVLFEIKAEEMGVEALEDFALKACQTIATPIRGAVLNELGKSRHTHASEGMCETTDL